MECELYLNKAAFEKSLLDDCSLTSIYDLCIAEARRDEGIERKVKRSECSGYQKIFFSCTYLESNQIDVILDSEDKQLVYILIHYFLFKFA